MDEIWVRNSDAEFSAILVKFLRQSDEFKFVFSHTDAYKLQILKQTLEQIFIERISIIQGDARYTGFSSLWFA